MCRGKNILESWKQSQHKTKTNYGYNRYAPQLFHGILKHTVTYLYMRYTCEALGRCQMMEKGVLEETKRGQGMKG